MEPVDFSTKSNPPADNRLFETWLDTIRKTKPLTAKSYGGQLIRLFAEARTTPEEALNKVIAEFPKYTTYMALRLVAMKFRPHIAHMMIFALRRFLYDNGASNLPDVRENKPEQVKPQIHMKYQDAVQVVAACSRPYNLVFELMLATGLGLREFCIFNTAENWENIKTYLASNPQAEYYRFDFTGRKRNKLQWYSLIPVTILRKIIANTPVPISANYALIQDPSGKNIKGKGVALNMERYNSVRIYLEAAFDTGLHRAPVKVKGKPSPHELRDVYRTRAHRIGVDGKIAEFSMGHQIDKLQYDKIDEDEAYVWSELKKLQEPAAATESEVAVLRNELVQTKEELAKLREIVMRAGISTGKLGNLVPEAKTKKQ
jgi:hypothetical protein